MTSFSNSNGRSESRRLLWWVGGVVILVGAILVALWIGGLRSATGADAFASTAPVTAGAALLVSPTQTGAPPTPLPTWTPLSPTSTPSATATATATTVVEAAPSATASLAVTPSAQAPAAVTSVASKTNATVAPVKPTAVRRPGATLGRISIPALRREAPVADVSWHVEIVGRQQVAVADTFNGIVGRHMDSAPLGGPGNTVLSGHTGGPNGGVFNGLWNLVPGDEVTITRTDGSRLDYVVSQVLKVQEVGASLEQRLQNAVYMAPTEDTRLTMITCWPEWAYTHRIIVIAYPR